MSKPIEREFMWWPHRKPIPSGWFVVKQHVSHHSYYSILIARDVA